MTNFIDNNADRFVTVREESYKYKCGKGKTTMNCVALDCKLEALISHQYVCSLALCTDKLGNGITH